MSAVRDHSLQGFIFYYFLQVFFVSTYFVGMALSLQLYMNPSFYIQAFCRDIAMKLKNFSKMKRYTFGEINGILINTIHFQSEIVQ